MCRSLLVLCQSKQNKENLSEIRVEISGPSVSVMKSTIGPFRKGLLKLQGGGWQVLSREKCRSETPMYVGGPILARC